MSILLDFAFYNFPSFQWLLLIRNSEQAGNSNCGFPVSM